ncbi:origin recognition complex subunit 6-like isoform X2 [Acanthaster planci]|uniref:Origin recognition complex subunit 6 n=1 Tax=Acanthaster planci TaxID=133434 RepID=A0A8B7XQR2_ACAPL|nr:origin recognition complex subunit 6-like isoform X2 [Acanthaster planci]
MNPSEIKTLALKIGISSKDVIRKAEELLRLCEIRCMSATALGPNSTCQAVMCIELAATSVDQPIDKNAAIRCSGVTRKVYTTLYKTLENILEMKQDIGIRDLAVQFGCLPAVNPALEILARYRKECEGKMSESARDDVNFNSSLFTTGSLYTACRHLKIKVEKSKFLLVAGVKKSTFDRLSSDLTTHATAVIGERKTGKSKRQGHWLEDLEKSFEECSPPKRQPIAKQHGVSNGNNDYEEWKRKILEGTKTNTQS